MSVVKTADALMSVRRIVLVATRLAQPPPSRVTFNTWFVTGWWKLNQHLQSRR